MTKLKTGIRQWHWLAALALALLVHLSGLSLVNFEVPRTPEPSPNNLMVSLGNTGTTPMDHRQEISEEAEAPKAENGQAEAAADLPQGNSAYRPVLPQSPPPAKPAAPAAPKPVAKDPPAPKPTEAPLAESIAPLPRATNPPLPNLPEALVPDQPKDGQSAKPESRPIDQAFASLPANVSARLGAIGGGPVWLNGKPPKNAGMVPWGSDYWNELFSWLEERGRYPPEAARKRLEGTALLEFVLERSGKVLTYRLLQSTGHYVLDFEIKRMIKWSSPVPPPPATIPDSALRVIVPVVFETYG